MRDTFSTRKKVGTAGGDQETDRGHTSGGRDALKSQGAPKQGNAQPTGVAQTIDLNAVKPPARKMLDDELN